MEARGPWDSQLGSQAFPFSPNNSHLADFLGPYINLAMTHTDYIKWANPLLIGFTQPTF